MPRTSTFSTDDDATIVSMRAEGATWEAIAVVFGRGYHTIRDHAYRSGLVPRGGPTGRMLHGAAAIAQAHAVTPPTPRDDTAQHEPMRAFHPVSWGAIWNGLSSRP